ncbi:MAG TPA: hypothetical protein VF399_06645 [bacterium]
MIKVEDLAKNYNGLQAVDGVSFSVEERDIFSSSNSNTYLL